MPQDSSDKSGETDSVSTRHRREILMSMGAVGAMGLAGCSGDGSADDTPSDMEGGTETDKVVITDRTYRKNRKDQSAIGDTGYNFVKAAESVGPGETLLFDWAMLGNTRTGDIMGNIFDDWSVDGTTMSITMREDFTWHNGDPVNADDVVTQLKLGVLFGSARRVANASGILEDYSAIKKTGEYSLEAEMAAPVNPKLAMLQVFASGGPKNVLIFAKHSKWGQFAEQLTDSTTEEEENSIKSEVVNTDWSIDDFQGNGPWKIKDYTNSAILFEKHEGHPHSDNINFKEVEIRPFADSATRAMGSKSIDFASGVFTQSDIGQVPDIYDRVPFVRPGGPSVIPNHGHEIFGRTKVKQALAHIIDNQKVVDAQGSSRGSPGSPLSVAINDSSREKFISGKIEGNLISYDSPEKAASLLKEEGFTREDGDWYKPNGDRWSFELKTFNQVVFNPVCRNVASQWSDFGIDCTPKIIAPGTFFSEFPQATYDIAVEWSGASMVPNPLIGLNRNMVGFGGGSMAYPEEVQAPPVGEPDGSLETYVVSDLLTNARTASNDEAFTNAVQELLWIQNYTLPTIQNTFLKMNFFANTETFSWPEEEEKYFWNAPRGQDSVMARRGWKQAKQS
ncbi:ABC transporter substrate-binding protein [Haloarcula marina]|uniref:ABC transporter substrate-binding protein n=1 Tax=Haloarcula marina TaxID=2961574 RepID=UPI0020B724F2|nr:ABC transporter substrate-binding protein [Halomicroarcula marina]